MNKLPMPQGGRALKVEPLTAAVFAPFGDVIEATDANPATQRLRINAGFAERFHDLAKVDLGHDLHDGGRPLINIFRAQPRTLPFNLLLLERHPLGSQAFMPLAQQPYLVVVAPEITGITGITDSTDDAGNFNTAPDLNQVRCFLASGTQGVNYARGTWHHPLLALQNVSDFLVVDRGGPGNNLDEHSVPGGLLWIVSLT